MLTVVVVCLPLLLVCVVCAVCGIVVIDKNCCCYWWQLLLSLIVNVVTDNNCKVFSLTFFSNKSARFLLFLIFLLEILRSHKYERAFHVLLSFCVLIHLLSSSDIDKCYNPIYRHWLTKSLHICLHDVLSKLLINKTKKNVI